MSNRSATEAQRQQQRGGGSSCTVCHHSRRDEFDRAMASGAMTQAAVAREIGCHRSIVHRHEKNHVLPEVRRQIVVDPVLSSIDVLAEIRDLFTRMKRHLARAEATDNWQAIRALHSEARMDLETLAKLTGKLSDGPTINVVISPQWVEIRTSIISALEDHPEARIAVAEALAPLEGGSAP